MADSFSFKPVFEALTGHAPFPWQQRLFDRFTEGDIPSFCNLPTGLGKTNVIAIWLIALARTKGKLPRRLVYVVNRRTVVDQATDEVRKLCDNLGKAGLTQPLLELCAFDHDIPLAISTLRGQFADNGEWAADPGRPAIIVGTVDMIGSRLLFSGYGIGFKRKPLHAGFLGQDVLLVHDEAHLEPAFSKLLWKIEREQRCDEKPVLNLGKSIYVMELSATSRIEPSGDRDIAVENRLRAWKGPLELDDDDRKEQLVKDRLYAVKRLKLQPVEGSGKNALSETVAKYAGAHDCKKCRVLIYVRSPDTALVVAEFLRKKLKLGGEEAHQRIGLLTGTLRGYERDKLAESDLFKAFASDPNRPRQLEKTLYLVSTSAGEVGVDLDANHLVCDLTTLDSMIQRFGRVNRLGGKDRVAEITVVSDADQKREKSATKKPKEISPLDEAIARTREILQSIVDSGGDVSPDALRRVLESQGVEKAFSPVPKMFPATDILFDAWALTTIRDKLPGRPPVEPYLHGISDWELPETYVAWREEVDLITGHLLERYKADDLLDDYPLKPHELLRHYTHRVVTELEGLTKRLTDDNASKELFAWVIDADGTVEIHPLPRLVERNKQKKPLVNLSGRTVVLPPAAGGLSEQGMLKGASPWVENREPSYDVGDEWRDEEGKLRRIRVQSDDARPKPPDGMRWLRTIDMRPDDEGDGDFDESSVPAKLRYWHWYESPRTNENEGSKSAHEPVPWQTHTNHVTDNATRIAKAVKLPDGHQEAIRLAGKFHDLGKKRELWQRSIGNPDPKNWLAKSGRNMKPLDLTDYRHEFGSVLDIQEEREFRDQPDDVKDLILHLVASGHGRGRPHFLADEAFDPEPKGKDVNKMAVEVVQRFARLQRKYGRWGLAYLESLLRAADYAASANPSAFVEKQPEDQQ